MQQPQSAQQHPQPDAEMALLPADDRQAVLQVAARTIAGALAHPQRRAPDVDPLQFSVILQQLRGTFTTLHCQGQLRGCRGSIVASEPLIVDVARSARAAAFFDDRFTPVSSSEIGGLEIHVSILSTPQSLPTMSEGELLRTLRVGLDGLIVQAGSREALFLPSMWKKLPDPREFVARLKAKAGLPAASRSESLTWQRFKVQAIAGCCADFLPPKQQSSSLPP